MSILAKTWRAARNEGLSTAISKAKRRIEIYRHAKSYRKWIREHDTLTEKDFFDIRAEIDSLANVPLISVLMPVYDVDEAWLRKAIESVRAQVYPNWELCIADDNSRKPHIKKVLEEYGADDGRIKIIFRETNGHISAASNSALKLVTGEFTALLDHDDELREHALFMVAKAVDTFPDAEIIYTDEDQIDFRGRGYDPKFKPDWSPDAFYSVNFTNHLTVYRTSLLRSVGGWRLGFEGSQDYDLMLRTIEKIRPEQIRHIPHVLYHWRAVPGSVALSSGEKTYAHTRGRMCLDEHFQRAGIAAKSVKGTLELHRTVYSMDREPFVSIVISGNAQIETIRGLISGTEYDAYEIIVVDNLGNREVSAHPRIRLIETGGTSFYKTLNDAAKIAKGSVISFIDCSTVIERPDWLREIAGYATQKTTGAVGAKILFPNRRIKHAGLILGIKKGVGRAHYWFPDSHYGINMRLSIAQNFSAVSADCLAIRKKLFNDVGGFDAANFPHSCADVDLCLRLQEKGYRNVWTPWAEVIQSGMPTEPDERELKKLKEKWPGYFERDPFFNPNLSNESEDFSLSFPPRIDKLAL